MRGFLIASSLLIAFGVWLPSQIKMLRTKSSKDYNIATFLMILWLQVSSFIVAGLDHSRSLEIYFAVNFANVLATLLLVLKYR